MKKNKLPPGRPKGSKNYTAETKSKARMLYFSGRIGSMNKLAKHLGIKRETVSKWIRHENWQEKRRKVEADAIQKASSDLSDRIIRANEEHFYLWDVFKAHVRMLTMPSRETGGKLPVLSPKVLSELSLVAERIQNGQRLAADFGGASIEQTIRIVYPQGGLAGLSSSIERQLHGNDSAIGAPEILDVTPHAAGNGNGNGNGSKASLPEEDGGYTHPGGPSLRNGNGNGNGNGNHE
jgi:transposase-like protein